jgi:hypothetical protein
VARRRAADLDGDDRSATSPVGKGRDDYTPEKLFSAEQLSEIRRNFALLRDTSKGVEE